MRNNMQLKILDHCIACTTCQNVAPNVYALNEDGSTAVIHTQPLTSHDEIKSLEAMRSCPVAAIGVK